MLLYIILFILLQPDLLSKKKGLIYIPEIVLRSFVFIAIIYVVKQYEEGFQAIQIREDIQKPPPMSATPKGIQISGDEESLRLVGMRATVLYNNFTDYLSNIVNYTTTAGVPNFFGNMPTYT
jgi:hypothetical protein